MLKIHDYLKEALPTDHYRQCRATDLVTDHYRGKNPPADILDLGCGVGSSIDFFRGRFDGAKWTGVDIEESPEVAARVREDAEFRTYDGVNLPFEDHSFDLVYSNQVMEHVRHPERVLSEITRVLRRDGAFIGQTSQLEPYHSFSLFNFTIYGWKRIVEDAGMKLKLLRPGIDAITLIERSMKGRPPYCSQWFSNESPANMEIEFRAGKSSVPVINYESYFRADNSTLSARWPNGQRGERYGCELAAAVDRG